MIVTCVIVVVGTVIKFFSVVRVSRWLSWLVGGEILNLARSSLPAGTVGSGCLGSNFCLDFSTLTLAGTLCAYRMAFASAGPSRLITDQLFSNLVGFPDSAASVVFGDNKSGQKDSNSESHFHFFKLIINIILKTH